jgi:hypothetical protein
MKHILLIMGLVLVATASGAHAYRDKLSAVHYDVGFGLGKTGDYIDDTSWRGWGLDFRQYADRSKPFMWGFTFAWQVMSKRTSDTYDFEKQGVTGAITGVQRRYINTLPFLLTGHWVAGDPKKLRVSVGGGAGVYYIIERLEIGVYDFEASNWHFGLMPEADLQIPFGQDMDIFLAGRYHYAFGAGTSLNGEGVTHQYFTVSAGLAWMRW